MKFQKNEQKYHDILFEIEKMIKISPNIEDAVVTLEKTEREMLPLHLHDLFPEDNRFILNPGRELTQKKNISHEQNESLSDSTQRLSISHGRPMEINSNEPKTIQEMLERASATSPNKGVTYIYPDGREEFQSYSELLHNAQKCLAGLKQQGLKPGDPVIFQFRDNKNFINAFWGCIFGGFLPTPIGIASTYSKDNAVISKLYNAWKLLNKPIILTDKDLVSSIKGVHELWEEKDVRVTSVEQFLTGKADHEWFTANSESLVLNLLTSGSTGVPKCVQHRNETIMWRTMATTVENSFNTDDVSLNWMPLDHVGGIVMFHVRDVYLGCNQFIGTIDSFIANPLNWLDWIDKYKVTTTWAPNFAFALINDLQDKIKKGKWDLSSVRHILNGGEAVVAKVAHQFLQILEQHGLPNDCMKPTFGMSETSSGIVESKQFFRNNQISGLQIVHKNSLTGSIEYVPERDPNAVVFTEVGRPHPGVSLRIVNHKNEVLPEGMIGRLQVKSPSVMNGYYNNPTANLEVFLDEGWFETGDLGFIADGKLSVTGRVKDVIIINGANYHNYEIESVVEEIEGVEVTFAAACAILDDNGIDQLAIFFVPTEDQMSSITELIHQIKTKISYTFGLTTQIIIPLKKQLFPKTNSGKIQRNKLTQTYIEGEYNDTIKQLDIHFKNDKTLPDWTYGKTWVESESGVVVAGTGTGTGSVAASQAGAKLGNETSIVFVEATDLNQQALEGCIVVQKGTEYKKFNSYHYQINPYSSNDYDELITGVVQDFNQIQNIIHCWNCKKEMNIINSLSDLKSSQYDSSFCLLFLVHALSRVIIEKVQLVVVTQQALAVKENEEIAYEQSTVPGLIKTIPQEMDHIVAKQIDLSHDDRDSMFAYIENELARDTDAIVAFREHKRWVPKIAKIDLKQTAAEKVPFAKNQLYLVTGGLGGIGKGIAKYLLKHYQAKLIIVGRTSLEKVDTLQSGVDEKSKTLDELIAYEKYGGKVFYRSIDICDQSELESTVHAIEAVTDQKLAGIIHLAGIIQEVELKNQSQQSLERMYEAKVYGTWVLHQLVKQHKDALFITSSSARTLHSGMTVGAYCSANEFIENFAHYQSAFVNSICLSWSLWDELGMGQGTVIKEALNQRGYTPIKGKQGLLSFLAALKSKKPLLYIGLNGVKKEIQRLSEQVEEPNFAVKVYVVSSKDANQRFIRDDVDHVYHMFEELKHIPIDVEFMEELPRNHKGEIDRDRLVHYQQQIPQEPRNETDKALISLWQHVLKLENLKASDNFFELGGNSLQATQLLYRIQEEFGVEFELSELFINPDMFSLSDVIIQKQKQKQVEGKGKETSKITRTSYGQLTPMSSSQKRQWYLYEMEPDNPFYNNTVVLKLQGEIDEKAMVKTIQLISDRHETMRTTFQVKDDQFFQVIHNTAEVEPVIVDLSSMEEADDRLEAIIQEESMKCFDLVDILPFRYTIVKTDSHQCFLIFSIHHIVSDGWSIGVFVNEFADVYDSILNPNGLTQGVTQLEPLAIQYTDFSVWQQNWLQSEECQKQIDYWKEHLAGPLTTLDLPTDLPRPTVQSYDGKTKSLILDQQLTQSLKSLSIKAGCTLYMSLLAGFVSMLHRYSGQEDVVIGSLVANRNKPELESIIGFFTNTLALRFAMDSELTYEELLKKVKDITTHAQTNQDVPFDHVIDQLNMKRDSSRHPLFQVLFVLQNAPIQEQVKENIKITPDIYYNETAKFDLSMQIFERDEQLQVILEYNTSLFFEATIDRMLGHYQTLMEAVVAQPSIKVQDIPFLTQEENKCLVEEWNPTDFEPAADCTIHQVFEERVREYADDCAVMFKGESLTYSELNDRANRLAKTLRDQGIKPEDIVGVMVEKSMEMVVSILAVLKSGGTYMPIDPDFPQERIDYMLENSQVSMVLTQRHLKDKLNSKTTIIDLNDERYYSECHTNLTHVTTPNHLAYVMYTSGSTGKPKGVMVEHASVVNILLNLQEKYPLQKEDVYLLKTPFTFDVAVTELFGWFHSGGKLAILEQGHEKDPLAILRAIEHFHVTHINFVPSMVNAFLQAFDKDEYDVLNRLKYVFVAGEALNPEIVKSFYHLTQGVMLENIYGPTESTIYATNYSLSEYKGETIIPIGKPMKNIRAYVLDKNDHLQPIGLVGELCLAGKGLARGYHNNEELTMQKFIDDPFHPGEKMYKTGDLVRWLADGNIQYLGRIDHQVKIRGIRIELGEVEVAIKEHIHVKDCIVTAISDDNGLKRLAAYISVQEKSEMNWQTYLNTRLPEYMIPSYFVVLDEFPMNHSGKVDRNQLPKINVSALVTDEEYVAPKSESETKLAEIWSSILGINKVGIHDDFFKLGGDSISVIQMISRLRKHGMVIEPKQVYVNKTIAQLVTKIKHSTTMRDIDQSVVTGKVPLTPIQQWFFEQRFEQSDHWNLPALISFTREYEVKHIQKALISIVNHHDTMRMTYQMNGNEPSQVIGDLVQEIDLEVVDCRTLDDAEQEKFILQKSCEAQASLRLEKCSYHPVLYLCNNGSQKLFLAVHHLLVDGVSWRIIVEDLMTALEQQSNGKQVQLANKTTSFKEWANALHDYAQTDRAKQELSYWQEIHDQIRPLELGMIHNANTEADYETIKLIVDTTKTQYLLQEANEAYHTNTNELLLTAFVRALISCTGSASIPIVLEGHGREDIDEQVDISRTIGWFTTQFPAVFNMAERSSIGEQLKYVKENLRSIPSKGIGYGILKYLSEEAAVVDYMTSNNLLYPVVCFNYLGQMNTGNLEGDLLMAHPSTGMLHSLEAKRAFLIEVNILIIEGQLEIYLTMNNDLLNKGPISQLSNSFTCEIERLVEYCLQPENKGFTPSDFPLSSLAQEELDALPTNIQDIYPLSPMQSGMLYHALMEDHTSSYNGRIHLTLSGALRADLLESAWNILARRHAILRTIYKWQNVSAPVQVVLKNHAVQLEKRVIHADMDLQQEITEIANKPFDLTEEVPFKIRLYKESDSKHHLIWSFHHIALDGWSVFLLIKECLDTYHELVQGNHISCEQAPAFKGYIQWYLQQDKDQASQFWKQYLAGIVEPTPLPGVYEETNTEDRQLRKETYYLPSDLMQSLEQFSKEEQVTVNTIFQAAWGILLRYYTGNDSIMYGCTVSGRPHQLEDVDQMVGNFINSLPLRIELSVEQTLKDIYSHLQLTTLEIKDYEYSLLPEIQEVSDIPVGKPLFQSLLIYQNYPVELEAHDGKRELLIEDLQGKVDINYDLVLEFTPKKDQILFEVYYNQSLWSPSFIDNLVKHFTNLLRKMLLSPQQQLKEISILSADEHHEIVQKWATQATVETLYEDQEEVYRGVNTSSKGTELYILDEDHQPVPIGVPGEIYVTSDDLERDCGSWSEWMRENSIPHINKASNRLLYKTGDIGMWNESGKVLILDLV